MVQRLQIANALGRLPSLWAIAIELAFKEKLPQEKIAKRMGYEKGTIQRWLSGAYELMEGWFWPPE